MFLYPSLPPEKWLGSFKWIFAWGQMCKWYISVTVSPVGVWSPSGKSWGLLRSSVLTGWTWAWPADWLLCSALCSGGWTYCREEYKAGGSVWEMLLLAQREQKSCASCLISSYLIIRASMRKSNSSCSEQTSGSVYCLKNKILQFTF